MRAQLRELIRSGRNELVREFGGDVLEHGHVVVGRQAGQRHLNALVGKHAELVPARFARGVDPVGDGDACPRESQRLRPRVVVRRGHDTIGEWRDLRNGQPDGYELPLRGALQGSEVACRIQRVRRYRRVCSNLRDGAAQHAIRAGRSAEELHRDGRVGGQAVNAADQQRYDCGTARQRTNENRRRDDRRRQ